MTMADRVKCWLCGENVKPDTRYPKCEQCQGHIVTPDPDKYKYGKPVHLTDEEAKVMMESADTYYKVRGRTRQKRHARD